MQALVRGRKASSDRIEILAGVEAKLPAAAAAMEGFSGREIAKFLAAVQAAVYGSAQPLLTAELWDSVLARKLHEHSERKAFSPPSLDPMDAEAAVPTAHCLTEVTGPGAVALLQAQELGPSTGLGSRFVTVWIGSFELQGSQPPRCLNAAAKAPSRPSSDDRWAGRERNTWERPQLWQGAKQSLLVYGDRSSFHFYHRDQPAHTPTLIFSLQLPGQPGQPADLTTPAGVKATCRAFHQHYSDTEPTGVYAAKPVDTATRATLLGSLASHLTPTQARAAEGPDGNPMLSEEELGRALQGWAHSKAWGLDGLPMEVYDRPLRRPLRAMLQEAIADTADPAPLADFLTGIIHLVPKAGKPRDQVASYRPITLLNCDVHPVARAVEDRLQLPLDLMVSPSQSAFFPGRDINDSVQFHLGLLEYLQQRGSPAWLLFLDLAGAYDNVSWGLLQDTMEAMGFCREGHVRWAQLLHRGAKSQVMVNGHLTDSFPLASGLLQGTGASPIYWSRLKGWSKEGPGRLAGEGGGQGGRAGAGGEGVEEVEGEEWLLGPWAHLQLDPQVWGMGTTTLLDFSVKHARVRLHQLQRVSADPLYPPCGGLWPALWGVRPPRVAGEPEVAVVADGALRELELKWEASAQQVADQGAAGGAHQRPLPQMRAAQQVERQLEAQQRRGGRQPVAQPAPRADTVDQLAVGDQAGQPCAKVWKELLDPTLRQEHVIPGHLETLTHAFLTCPAVVPAREWVLDVYGRLTGTRPTPGDAMLLHSGRPTCGEAPPFQPPDSLLWLRLRVAYLGAVWRLRSSGAATALQPQQVARRVVEEVISTLTTTVKRDQHRDLAGAYDNVSWGLLQDTMEAMGFCREGHVRWAQLLHRDAKSQVMVNGHLTDSFPLASGLLQGSGAFPIYWSRLKGRSKEGPGRLAGEGVGQGGRAGAGGKGVEEVEGEEWLLGPGAHLQLDPQVWGMGTTTLLDFSAKHARRRAAQQAERQLEAQQRRGGRQPVAQPAPRADIVDQLAVGDQAGQPCAKVWKELLDPTLRQEHVIVAWRVLHASLMVGALWGHILKGTAALGSSTCRFCQPGHLETLTHAFLTCPAVVPAREWVLDVYGRLTGTRPPPGDAMLLHSGRPTCGEAPPFQPPDSLLWLRLRVAYLGAVWRLRSSGAATALQPQQVARRVVEEVISTLTTTVKRDQHRVGRDIRVGLCGAVPSTCFKG
ncbi:hypothetical protein QJQ45_008748 [Haematococcus lacustris]|nr:hypothetical protein QJQ45_008748 [Haematococcus lacustris]